MPELTNFCFSEIVYANTLRPAFNREFEAVYHIKDIPGNDRTTYFYGFAVVQDIDIRHTLDTDDELFKARIWSSNSILFEMPSYSYALRHDRDNIESYLDPFVLEAIDNGNHNFVEAKNVSYLKMS